MLKRMRSGIRRHAMAVAPIRHRVVRSRIRWRVGVRRQLQVAEVHASAAVTVKHNLRSLMAVSDRAPELLRAAALVEGVREGRTLIIGCRNEDDLFAAEAIGYRRVCGLDLISYSRSVALGDMHAVPFADATFDAVVVPYTLAYSADPRAATAEYVRVCRPGGVVAIAVEYAPREQARATSEALLGYDLREGREHELDSADSVIELLGSAVDEVVVRYDALRRLHHTPSGYVRNPSPILVVVTVGGPAKL